MEHCLYVASVATTIARALHLNEDLVQTIAVGHDLGHAPFGHKGERSLNSIAKKHDLQFSHELQSLRVVDLLESPYAPRHPGLNLTFAVRDGIACHYGEGFEERLRPDRTKRASDLRSMKRGEAAPATLEGCVVRWADKIAYLGRDLEDALLLKLVKVGDIPASVRKGLGKTNREIIGSLVSELVENGTGNETLTVSAETHQALNDFYDFNMTRIYQTDTATRHFKQIDRATKTLFSFLLEELDSARGNLGTLRKPGGICLPVFADFLGEDVIDWRAQKKPRLVIDFIAGMTDSFFTQSFTEVFLPRSTV
jgi:dGTPase